MQLNDTERAALVDRVEGTINGLLSLVAIHGMKALQAPENRDLIRKESADIVTRLLADRAVPEPDADAVEAAAKAMYFTDANPDPVKYDRVSAWREEWEKHLAFYQSEGYDPEGFFPAFMLARAVLSAVPTEEPDLTLVYMKGYQDGQDAMRKSVDAAVDSASRKEASNDDTE